MRTGVAVGCGGDTEIFSRMPCSAACSLVVKSRAICCWLAASWSTFWRTAARPSEIVLSSCWSREAMAGTTVSGTVCATAACGANQLSSGYELAILSLAVSPYVCQTSAAKTPTQNVIRSLIVGVYFAAMLIFRSDAELRHAPSHTSWDCRAVPNREHSGPWAARVLDASPIKTDLEVVTAITTRAILTILRFQSPKMWWEAISTALHYRYRLAPSQYRKDYFQLWNLRSA